MAATGSAEGAAAAADRSASDSAGAPDRGGAAPAAAAAEEERRLPNGSDAASTAASAAASGGEILSVEGGGGAGVGAGARAGAEDGTGATVFAGCDSAESLYKPQDGTGDMAFDAHFDIPTQGLKDGTGDFGFNFELSSVAENRIEAATGDTAAASTGEPSMNCDVVFNDHFVAMPQDGTGDIAVNNHVDDLTQTSADASLHPALLSDKPCDSTGDESARGPSLLTFTSNAHGETGEPAFDCDFSTHQPTMNGDVNDDGAIAASIIGFETTFCERSPQDAAASSTPAPLSEKPRDGTGDMFFASEKEQLSSSKAQDGTGDLTFDADFGQADVAGDSKDDAKPGSGNMAFDTDFGEQPRRDAAPSSTPASSSEKPRDGKGDMFFESEKELLSSSKAQDGTGDLTFDADFGQADVAGDFKDGAKPNAGNMEFDADFGEQPQMDGVSSSTPASSCSSEKPRDGNGDVLIASLREHLSSSKAQDGTGDLTFDADFGQADVAGESKDDVNPGAGDMTFDADFGEQPQKDAAASSTPVSSSEKPLDEAGDMSFVSEKERFTSSNAQAETGDLTFDADFGVAQAGVGSDSKDAAFLGTGNMEFDADFSISAPSVPSPEKFRTCTGDAVLKSSEEPLSSSKAQDGADEVSFDVDLSTKNDVNHDLKDNAAFAASNMGFESDFGNIPLKDAVTSSSWGFASEGDPQSKTEAQDGTGDAAFHVDFGAGQLGTTSHANADVKLAAIDMEFDSGFLEHSQKDASASSILVPLPDEPVSSSTALDETRDLPFNVDFGGGQPDAKSESKHGDIMDTNFSGRPHDLNAEMQQGDGIVGSAFDCKFDDFEQQRDVAKDHSQQDGVGAMTFDAAFDDFNVNSKSGEDLNTPGISSSEPERHPQGDTNTSSVDFAEFDTGASLHAADDVFASGFSEAGRNLKDDVNDLAAIGTPASTAGFGAFAFDDEADVPRAGAIGGNLDLDDADDMPKTSTVSQDFAFDDEADVPRAGTIGGNLDFDDEEHVPKAGAVSQDFAFDDEADVHGMNAAKGALSFDNEVDMPRGSGARADLTFDDELEKPCKDADRQDLAEESDDSMDGPRGQNFEVPPSDKVSRAHDDESSDDETLPRAEHVTPVTREAAAEEVAATTGGADFDDDFDDFAAAEPASTAAVATGGEVDGARPDAKNVSAPLGSVGEEDDDGFDDDWDFAAPATAPAAPPACGAERLLRGIEEALASWSDRAQRCEACRALRTLEMSSSAGDGDEAAEVLPEDGTNIWEEWLEKDGALPTEARELLARGVSAEATPVVPLAKLGAPPLGLGKGQKPSRVKDVFYQSLGRHMTLPSTSGSETELGREQAASCDSTSFDVDASDVGSAASFGTFGAPGAVPGAPASPTGAAAGAGVGAPAASAGKASTAPGADADADWGAFEGFGSGDGGIGAGATAPAAAPGGAAEFAAFGDFPGASAAPASAAPGAAAGGALAWPGGLGADPFGSAFSTSSAVAASSGVDMLAQTLGEFGLEATPAPVAKATPAPQSAPIGSDGGVSSAQREMPAKVKSYLESLPKLSHLLSPVIKT
eukprot:TRINITY_DN6885_c0_g1_i1.p1 TRINITY_DN6885_c0_g1~~TRINITY_DN6885_c0_g1_i1.p1  ORF type:complete len:1749 (-),score=435.44 TRINITY_DN6885_c0_g1_i1:95-4771(-)